MSLVQLELQTTDGSWTKLTVSVVPAITMPIAKFPLDPGKFPILKELCLFESLETQVQKVSVNLLLGLDYYYSFVLSSRIPLAEGLVLLHTQFGWVPTG